MSIVGHLDLQASQTSIPVELTVIPVGLPIAATDWPLVGLTGLENNNEIKTQGKVFLTSLHFVSFFVISWDCNIFFHRSLQSQPSPLYTDSWAPPSRWQRTLCRHHRTHWHTLCSCSAPPGRKEKHCWRYGDTVGFFRFHTHGGAVPPLNSPSASTAEVLTRF